MEAIHIQTEIPGPESKALTMRRQAAVPRGVGAATPIFIQHAVGATLEDVDGNRILDLAGGIGCLNVGHRHPEIVAAIKDQTDAFLHLCFTVTGYESYVALAEKLNALAPGNFAKKTFLANSGAEAVENAIKIARAYTGRRAVLCVEDGFHGRTMLGLALTSKTHPYKSHFGPFLSDVHRIPFGVPASERIQKRSVTHEDVNALLESTFRRVVGAEDIAAVIVEPVLGEGGFVVPPDGFLPALAEICARHGIVFIADEVQTGFGRTGELFAATHFGLVPDLILTAKSLGGGLPIAAVTGRATIMDSPVPGGLGGTFGGNPVSCAAALAVIEAFADGHLTARARYLGERFEQRAQVWQQRHPIIADIRGIGAMRAIEFANTDGTPHTAAARALVQDCLQRGVLLLTAGTYDNVVRLLVPLTITDEEFEEALLVLETSLDAIAADHGALTAANP